MCDKFAATLTARPNPDTKGLYHSPKVGPREFEIGLEIARKRNRPLDHTAPCVCKDPAHIFQPTPDGWALINFK